MENKKTIDHYGFDKKAQEKAKKYDRINRRLSLVQYTFFVIVAIFVMKFGISTDLKELVFQYTSNEWAVVALYFMIGFLCFWLVSLPFSFYSGYFVEHKFKLSTQSRRSWMFDQIKGLIVMTILLLLIVEAIYYVLRTFPTYWWVIAWIFMSVFMVVMVYIGPVLLMPIFFKYKPLKNNVLVQRLTGLAKKAGINVIGVYEMKASVKTKKAIGALAGIGNTRRIILSDTLLNKYTPDEIECVIGHELGHHVYRHLGKLLAMVSVLFFVGLFIVDQVLQRTVTYFGFSGIGDIASLPLLALVLGLFFLIVTPIQNTISRKLEGHADQYELELVNKPDAHISLMVKLYDQNLRHADPHPIIEFIYHSHPSGKKRIERARRYKRSRVYG